MSLTVCSTDVGVGDVAGERVRLAAVRADLGDQVVERIAVAGQREHRRAAFGDRDRRRPADAAGRAGDDHVPTDQRAGRVVATGPVWVEVLGPVPPQRRARRTRTRAPLSRCRATLSAVLLGR